MRNKKYWSERMKALEDEQYQKSMDCYRDIAEQFRQASNSVQMDIERWYRRLAENNDVSYQTARKLLKKEELEEFKWTLEQYIEKGRENALHERWVKELENASARHHISFLEAMKLQIRQHAELLHVQFENTMTDFLHRDYAEQFYRTAYEFARGSGAGFNLARLDEGKIDLFIRHPWAQDGKNFSDRIWSNKEKLVQTLHTELSQCVIRGEAPAAAVGRLAKKMDVSKAQAGNLVLTESAAIASAARKNCYKELEVERYQFEATLDGKTCEICQSLDQKVFKMSEYEEGMTAPPLHPRCRCCTTPYFDDWEELGLDIKRAARDPETGKTVYVDGKLKYEDWKEQYLPTTVAGEKKKVYNSARMKISFPDEISKIRGVTDDVRERLDMALHKLETEYDIRLKSVSVEPAEKGDIFVTGWYKGGMGLVINRDADLTRVQKLIDSRYKAGMFAGKTLEDYIAHEMFHVMAYQNCTTQQQYQAQFKQIEGMFDSLRGISGYADRMQSGNEALAEAFVRLRNGEDVPVIAKVLVESYTGRWKK